MSSLTGGRCASVGVGLEARRGAGARPRGGRGEGQGDFGDYQQRLALYQLPRAPRGWDGGLRHEKASRGNVILVVRRELRGDFPLMHQEAACCSTIGTKTKTPHGGGSTGRWCFAAVL